LLIGPYDIFAFADQPEGGLFAAAGDDPFGSRRRIDKVKEPN
jgi:hypothetical protein